MSSLSNQVVCVTGAGRGLGAAIARAFSQEGAMVVLASRDVGGVDEAAASMQNAMAVQCDVAEVAELWNLMDAVVGEFGKLDVMVNCAGNAVFGHFLDVNEREYDEIFVANVRGAFFGSQVALSTMKENHSGLIVNVAADPRGWRNASVYAAANAAIREMTRCIAEEAAQYNVRVTALVSKGVNTPLWKEQEFLPFPTEIDPSRDFLDPDVLAGLLLDIARRADTLVVPEILCAPVLPLRLA